MAIFIILIIAFISRIVCIGIAIGWNWLFKNIHFKSNALLFNAITQHNTENILWNSTFLEPFTRWDGEYFIKIAHDETYTADFHHAFFPGYPLTIIFIRWLFLGHNTINVTTTIFIGFIISNVSFIIGVVGLYYFCQTLFELCHNNYYSQNKLPWKCHSYTQMSLFTIILYSFNPANIFMSSLYSESLFSAVTLWGFYFLNRYELQYKITPAIITSYIYLLIGCILLSYGVCIRSNGILSLIPLFFYMLRTSPILGCYDIFQKKNNNTLQQFFRHWILALCAACFIIFPLCSILGYGYNIYCQDNNNAHNFTLHHVYMNALQNALAFIKHILFYRVNQKSTIKQHSENLLWCTSMIPSIYGAIQQKYWNVGFLHYWKLEKLDRFIYSFPFYSMTLMILYRFITTIIIKESLYKNKIQCCKYIIYHPCIGFLLQLGVITFCMSCIANVEVQIRMLSGYPIYYIGLTALLLSYSKTHQEANRSTKLFFKIYTFFHSFCYFIGPIYFALYMTWT